MYVGHVRRFRQHAAPGAFIRVLAVVMTSLACMSAARASVPNSSSQPRSLPFGECARGYRQNSLGACVPITVPPHAYLDELGDFWDCARGYRQGGQRCVAVQVPVHAHLMDTEAALGKGWECDLGYFAQGSRCASVS